MDEEKKNIVEEEEVEFDDIIREHVVGLLTAAEELPVDDEAKYQLEREARAWYSEFSKTHIEASKLIEDSDYKLRGRESEEEIRKAEIEARRREQNKQMIFDGVKVALTIALTTGVPLLVYTRQQNKILAAEYCDNKYVLDKNFQDDKAMIMKLISKFNG